MMALALAVNAAAQEVPAPQPRPPLGEFDAAQVTALSAVNAYFNGIRTMHGEFLQVGPSTSELKEGEFYFARPGLLRLNYYPPSEEVMISDGNLLSHEDTRRGTKSIYQLDRTPLGPLLAQYTDLTSEDNVRDVLLDSDEHIVVVLAAAEDGGWLSLYFDRQSYAFEQWVSTDARGNVVTFMMFEAELNQPMLASLFEIDRRDDRN